MTLYSRGFYNWQASNRPARCREVAEHLPAETAETIIGNLSRHADVIAFSAAIPGQGAAGHVNKRRPRLWAALFTTRGY